MTKIEVKETTIKTIKFNGDDYLCITDIARLKNPVEPKDVIKNWMRSKNTLEYLGLWEMLNNPDFKGVEIDPLTQKTTCTRAACAPTSSASEILHTRNHKRFYLKIAVLRLYYRPF